MGQFRYRALHSNGSVIEGMVDAIDRAEVIRRIEFLGHIPIEAQKVEGSRPLPAARSSPRASELTSFFADLSLLLESGLSLNECLEVVGDGAPEKMVKFAATVSSGISSGRTFSESVGQAAGTLSPAYVSMIEAGETSGKLPAAIKAIAEDLARLAKLREGIWAAVRYPAFLMLSAALVLSLFLLVVIPQFEPIFADVGGRLNDGAAAVLALSRGLRANWDLVLGGLIAILLLVVLLASRPQARAGISAIAVRLPLISSLYRNRRTARFLGMLSLLTGHGIPLPAAVRLCRVLSPEKTFRIAVDNLHGQIRSGRRFSDALLETDLLPKMAIRMLKVGEEAGDVPRVAKQASSFFEHKFEVGLSRLLAVVGPVTIVLVSLIVGSLVVSIMTALLNITELAQ